MIIAVTIILIMVMICGTILTVYYWENHLESVNIYTLNDVRNIENEIRETLKQLRNG